MSPELLKEVAERAGMRVVEEATIPGRQPTFEAPPQDLHAEVAELISRRLPRGIYRHQAIGVATALTGDDLVMATPTASGKSLVFLASALDRLKREPRAKILALYPARALIQDQLGKWQSWAAELGVTVSVIDGGISTKERPALVEQSGVVLMTPDVAHAWLLGRCGSQAIADFLRNLRLLILDEAHVYDGVFGTNMAYFLRRLTAAAGPHQLICSTATLGTPGEFVRQLTGRTPSVVEADQDASPASEKTLLRARFDAGNAFEAKATLVRGLSEAGGRFLAFADSRRMVELIVSAMGRMEGDSTDDLKGDEVAQLTTGIRGVMPYRSGYEDEDRAGIQRALDKGELVGVVSTSAMELGLDIGEIDIVALLTPPPTVSAFWQRLGRAGRRGQSVCLVLDDPRMGDRNPSLQQLMTRPVEPNWLYLQNRYIQYANALCAAQELQESGTALADADSFGSLPPQFIPLVENELNPTEPVPPDLYTLKQRAQGGPHYEFPLRSAMEQQFAIVGPFSKAMGRVSYSQALREAYPGAIYYYMATPYRVTQFRFRDGEIHIRRDSRRTTRPIFQSMVFPRFAGGILQATRGGDAFVVESELQVSERVLGFTEQRGSTIERHLYEVGSTFAQRPATRFFQTTGVCWHFGDSALDSEEVAQCILEAFCRVFGVQPRDLGIGRFHANTGPFGEGEYQGWCIYDGVHGSLRLTERLAANFSKVVESIFAEDPAPHWSPRLRDIAKGMVPATAIHETAEVPDSDWVRVVAAGERAMYHSDGGPQDVTVVGLRYTPRGLMYELEPPPEHASWHVSSTAVEPLSGVSRCELYNLMTGESKPLDGAISA